MGEILETVTAVRVWEPCASIVFTKNRIQQTAAVCVTPIDGKKDSVIDAYVMQVVNYQLSDEA